MLLTLRGGPESLAPKAHQIPVSLMVFSTFLCRAFTAHAVVMVVMVDPPNIVPGGTWLHASAQERPPNTTADRHGPRLHDLRHRFATIPVHQCVRGESVSQVVQAGAVAIR